MVVALVTTALLIADLYPDIWKSLLDARVAKLIGIVVALTVIIILLAIGGASLRWTGFGERKLWDWQTLLFVPITVALIASLLTLYQSTRQQVIETQRAQEARELETLRAERDMVQAYLEDMGTFVLEKDLRGAGENDDVRLLARARTLAVLDSVSGTRKVRVLEFMFETELLQFRSDRPPVVSLRFADLRETHLVKRSILSNTDLDRADLNDAKLINAKLINATLTKADLRGANLSGTDLSEADLSGADLRGVKMWTAKQLREAESLEGATMPDGQTLKSDDNPDGPTLKEWLKSKGREEDRENGSQS
jgi:putative effector of murein hydrolase LrgA (UPF0299 family)